jgi:hypothetical protein
LAAPSDPMIPWSSTPPIDWPNTCDSVAKLKGFGFSVVYESRRRHSVEDKHYQRYAEQSGWPLRSLECIRWESSMPGATGVLQSGFKWCLENTGINRVFGVQRLPLRPMPAGFILNSAMFAAVMWLAWCGPRAVIRSRRRRQGRCSACGYSRAGFPVNETCPECGVSAVC